MSVIRIEIEVPDQDQAYSLANGFYARHPNLPGIVGYRVTVDTDTKAQIRRTALAWASLVLKEDL